MKNDMDSKNMTITAQHDRSARPYHHGHALAGTLGYLVNGWNAAGTPALTLGYVYLPALVLVSLVSMVMAPMGARLAHRLPVALLKKIFAGLLMALCAKMLHSIFG